MLAGRSAGLYSPRVGMATGTLPRGADENPVYVAGLTANQGMFEIQRKTGLVMIKIRPEVKRSRIACIATS